jgi:hypothetical protein
MNDPDPVDGTGSLPVHGDASFPPGVPVPSSPPEATGLASRTPERDAAAGPRSVPPARSGDQAAPGLRGAEFLAEVKRVQAEQGRQRRGDPGRRRTAAQRAAPAYRPGGNRRGGRQ